MVAIRQPTTEFIGQRNRLTPAEPLQHHALTLTCRHAGEFQIVAGENVPRVLDLQLLATSEENRIGPLISFLRSSLTTMSASPFWTMLSLEISDI